MTSKRTVIILVVALVAAFLVLFMLPQQYVPYSKGQNYAKYEGFAELNNANGSVETLVESADNTSEKKDEKPTNSGSLMDSVKTLVSGNSTGNLKSGFEGFNSFEPLPEYPKTIEYGPLRDSEIIDKFSQVTQNGMDGKDGCVSSGLSNSGGYICLTPELIQMLKTRGGNASGGDATK